MVKPTRRDEDPARRDDCQTRPEAHPACRHGKGAHPQASAAHSKVRAVGPEPPRRPARQPLGRAKRLVFSIASVLLPLVLLAGVEGVLRLCGRGGYPPTMRAIAPASGGTLIVTDPAGAASYFYASRSRAGAMFENAFFSPKPAGVVRIIFTGESAAKGFPQPPALSASSFLQAMLEDLWPGRRVEMINMATTAVASFPVLDMLREAVDYQPDLVVAYYGNNEFFGAYGVASVHRAGSTPWQMRLIRRLRSLAILQLFERRGPAPADDDRTLMELVVAQGHIGPDDPLRAAAARNLEAHTAEMAALCKSRAVPLIVCTPPCNERDLAPLGEPDLTALSAAERVEVEALVAEGAALVGSNPAAAIASLSRAVDRAAAHATGHYLLGKAHFGRGDFARAQAEFRAAIDLDPMPWRPPSAAVEAIRRGARRGGAILCDLQRAFRDASPGGCIGMELMDDHVHPSLEGQYLVARSIVGSMTQLPGSLAVDAAAGRLPTREEYAARLGENVYDRYGVVHTLRVVSNVPFIRKTNPGLYDRFDQRARELEAAMPARILDAAREWQTPRTHGPGIQRPLSGMVAKILIGEQKFREAESLCRAARRCVPLYSSLHLEYTYFLLACRERVNGALDEADRRTALEEIERGRLLLAQGRAESGQVERFVARLHQLRGEYREALPLLLSARKKLSGADLLAADHAIAISYKELCELSRAREFLMERIATAGPNVAVYRRMLAALGEAPASSRPMTP